jgi:hypothetical protein
VSVNYATHRRSCTLRSHLVREVEHTRVVDFASKQEKPKSLKGREQINQSINQLLWMLSQLARPPTLDSLENQDHDSHLGADTIKSFYGCSVFVRYLSIPQQQTTSCREYQTSISLFAFRYPSMTQADVRTTYHVSFSTSGDTYIPNNDFYKNRKKDEVKMLWYSREELMDSCNEAKNIVQLIHLVGGKLEAIDHSRHCVVGLEKYHGKKEREKYRKILIRSVLIRQEMNRGLGLGASENGCLSEISQMMSASFKEFALWQAAMHEFHAYGSSKPSQSLLSSNFVVTKRTCPPSGEDVDVVAKRPRKCMLELETNFGPSRDPIIIAGHVNPIERMKVSADATNMTNTVQNQISLHQDMAEVMKGYVERKRLRSEVGTLVEAQYQVHDRQPISYSPSTTRRTENPCYNQKGDSASCKYLFSATSQRNAA